MDVAGWHLFLKDVRVGGSFSLAQGLAQQLGPQIDGTGFKGADLQALLKKVSARLCGVSHTAGGQQLQGCAPQAPSG